MTTMTTTLDTTAAIRRIGCKASGEGTGRRLLASERHLDVIDIQEWPASVIPGAPLRDAPG